ncbi:unnamed protein product, partial [Strongylus vulgaris]
MPSFALQLIVLLSVSSVSSSSANSWIRRNLENGKLYEFDGSNSPPSNIARVRLVITTTNIRKQPSPLPIHIFRIRWTESRNAAAYRVHCEANATDEVITILDREIADNITGIDERFILPQGRLSVLCGVAAVNSYGSSAWTDSPLITVQTAVPEISERENITKPIGNNDQVDVEDLDLYQLLQLIHASHIEDLPPKPLMRDVEERVIIGPGGE